MSSPLVSSVGSWSAIHCQQCGHMVDDSRYCTACGAYQKLTVVQAFGRATQRAMLGSTFGVISGAGCALAACFMAVRITHLSLTLGELGRVAELCVLTGAALGAIFDGLREVCRY